MSSTTVIESRTACEISATALGAVVGAIGTTGSPLGIIVGGAVGYLLGKVVCKISAIERAFDKALGNGNWAPVEQAMLDPANRAEAIAIISSEAKISEARANEIWSTIVESIKINPSRLTNERSFSEARYHPPHSQSRHGLAILDLTTPKVA